MKPFVITVKDDKKIILTKEELEEIIEKAYNQGVSDGSNQPIITPITTPTYPWYEYKTTPVAPWWYNPYITITCGGIEG